MAEGCEYFKQFLQSESKELRKALLKHQEELSKKLKKKIAQREAELDFIQCKMWSFASDFRSEYCKTCPGRQKCELFKIRLKKMRTAKRIAVIGKVVRRGLKKTGRKKIARKKKA